MARIASRGSGAKRAGHATKLTLCAQVITKMVESRCSAGKAIDKLTRVSHGKGIDTPSAQIPTPNNDCRAKLTRYSQNGYDSKRTKPALQAGVTKNSCPKLRIGCNVCTTGEHFIDKHLGQCVSASVKRKPKDRSGVTAQLKKWKTHLERKRWHAMWRAWEKEACKAEEKESRAREWMRIKIQKSWAASLGGHSSWATEGQNEELETQSTQSTHCLGVMGYKLPSQVGLLQFAIWASSFATPLGFTGLGPRNTSL